MRRSQRLSSISMRTGISNIMTALLLCLPLLCGRAEAQQPDVEEYRRSSLYSLLIAHPEFRYGEEISQVFHTIPIPEKFNDHNLNRRVLNSLVYNKKGKDEPLYISNFLDKNAIARRLVAKWYNRDKATGAFDMSLISERGYYDASFGDVQASMATIRGLAQLADAGEELVQNTFVLVNDIYYVDKEVQAQKWSFALDVLGAVADGIMGTETGLRDVASIVKDIEGFRVVVVSHLYRLNFSEDVMWEFYEKYYFDKENIDPDRRAQFDALTGLFKLEYVDSQVVSSGKTSIKGVNTDTPDQMIRKVCTRAIDKSIVELQRANELFRVKMPLYTTTPAITAKIGMKEGVTESSRYEVLLPTEDEDGRTKYERQGIIRPIKGKVWDNRYMSVEELAENATLDVTTFEVVSGCKNIAPGMLIREIF